MKYSFKACILGNKKQDDYFYLGLVVKGRLGIGAASLRSRSCR